MKCWQSSQMLQLFSLARVPLCAGFSSRLRLRCLLWRIPYLTPGEPNASGLLSAHVSGTLGSSSNLPTLAAHIDWGIAVMQAEGQGGHL